MQLLCYCYWISLFFLDPYNIKKKVVKYTDDGIPFITVTNRAILYCQHGADQHVKTKAKYTESVRVRLSFVLQPSVELDEPKIELCLPLLKQFNLTHPYTHQSSFNTWRKNFYLRWLDQINYVKATTKHWGSLNQLRYDLSRFLTINCAGL